MARKRSSSTKAKSTSAASPPAAQILADAPFAGFGHADLAHVVGGDGAVELAREAAAVVGVVEADVVDLPAVPAQALGAVAHGAEDQRELLGVMRGVAHLAGDFGEQHAGGGRVGAVECGDALADLIAEHENEAVRHGRSPSGSVECPRARSLARRPSLLQHPRVRPEREMT